MSYSYTDGDGLASLDKTLPNGAIEPVSNLDDALKQVKAFLVDPLAGVAKDKTDITNLTNTGISLTNRVANAEAAITSGAAAITSLQIAQAATQSQVDSLVIIAGGAPVTFIVTMSAIQDCLSVDILNGVEFDTIAIDSDSGFDVGTHIYTVPKAGLYDVLGSVKLVTSASAVPVGISHRLVFKVNGVEAAEAVVPCSDLTDDRTIELGRAFQLAATNTIELLYKVSTSGGTMTSQIQLSSVGTILQGSRRSA